MNIPRLSFCVVLLAGFLLFPLTYAQPTTRTSSGADLEARANQAFAAGDYKTALPLLKDTAVRMRNSPERVGPILERIRVAEANLGAAIQGDQNLSVGRTAHAKPEGDLPMQVTLQNLGNFDYDADNGGNIPDDVKALEGVTVKLRGFMLPLDESTKITRFVLVPDLFACCFGQPPQLQHTAVVLCPDGKAVSYYPDEIDIVGTLSVREIKEDGFIISIFNVTAQSVKPAPK